METLNKTTTDLYPTIPSFFDDFFTRDFFNYPSGNFGNKLMKTPAANIFENKESYNLEIAAPGMKKEDFQIELDNNLLSISSQENRSNEDYDDEAKFTRREFNYYSFKRSFSLPEKSINKDAISANYTDGILKIHIPKKAEEEIKKVKQIQVL